MLQDMTRQIPRTLQDSESVRQFLKGFHAEATRETYCKKNSSSSDFCQMSPDELLAETPSRKSNTALTNLIGHSGIPCVFR